eukprot:3941239-Rhodomonas_salina.1
MQSVITSCSESVPRTDRMIDCSIPRSGGGSSVGWRVENAEYRVTSMGYGPLSVMMEAYLRFVVYRDKEERAKHKLWWHDTPSHYQKLPSRYLGRPGPGPGLWLFAIRDLSSGVAWVQNLRQSRAWDSECVDRSRKLYLPRHLRLPAHEDNVFLRDPRVFADAMPVVVDAEVDRHAQFVQRKQAHRAQDDGPIRRQRNPAHFLVLEKGFAVVHVLPVSWRVVQYILHVV